MHERNVSKIRRHLLKGITGARALPFIGALGALQIAQANAADGITSLVAGPYGAIAPSNDVATGLPLLQLPPGFTYRSFGWRGDIMSDGRPCPGGHDGRGVISANSSENRGDVVLVRNHEIDFTAPNNFIEAPAMYDRGTNNGTTGNMPGRGTTSLVFRDGKWVSMVQPWQHAD